MIELQGAELKAELERRWREHGLVSGSHRARWRFRFRNVQTGEEGVLGGIPGSKYPPDKKRPKRRRGKCRK